MVCHDAEARVQLPSQLAHLAHIVRDALLPPAIGRRLEQSHERSGRSDDNVLPEAAVEEIRVGFERRAEERLSRNEHHHDFRRRLELLPDRKSTRLNSSHTAPSYAVFCLKT